MLFQHATYVAIPGTFIEQIDYQAISNLERATITLYCIIVETNQELDVQVFLPTSLYYPSLHLFPSLHPARQRSQSRSVLWGSPANHVVVASSFYTSP